MNAHAISPTDVRALHLTATPPQAISTAAHPQHTLTPVRTQMGSMPSTPTVECDHASPGNPIDITVPDDSSFEPGQSFTKTWRLLNTGSCTWTTDYAATWFSGATFGAGLSANLSGPVPPGNSVDVSIDMVAPAQPGTYQSNWKIKNQTDQLFGIGPTGDAPFWVRIVVIKPPVSGQEATPIPTPTPRVYAAGLANLTVNDGLDLDLDRINTGKTDDLIYQDKNSAHQIAPTNGAQMAQFGKGQPSMTDCQSARLSGDPQALDGVTPGMYFCYKTNLGLPGWARLVYLNPNDLVLTIEILTWSTP
jgi:hypothetical protein